jgi:uncharacterized protein YecT (DUF1311 family)
MKNFRQRSLLGTVLAVCIVTSVASWAQDDGAIEVCHNLQSTVDIVDCLSKVNTQWDKRLNTAYQKALKSVDPAGVPALRAAERAWLEYRKQRCSYLSEVPGTIGRVIGADCFVGMTRTRALELEEDAKGLGPG